MIHSLKSLGGTGNTSANSSLGHSTENLNASIEEPQPSGAVVGHLSVLPGGHFRYVEPSFFACTPNKPEELDDLFASQARHSMRSAARSSTGTTNKDSDNDEHSSPTNFNLAESPHASSLHVSSLSFLRGKNIPVQPIAWHPDFVQQLPERAVCEELMQCYIRGYHSIAPMLHVPTFRQKFDRFWNSYRDLAAAEDASVSFATLLTAVCYAGTKTSPEHLSLLANEGAAGVGRRLRRLGLQGLKLAHFPKLPTLETLIAFILLQSSCAKEEESSVCHALL
jgi:hypothetical protein